MTSHPLRLLFALSSLLALPWAACAQFYAPDTEYHDPVQRVFVVEAARVLAWWTDPGATNFAQVTYAITTKPDGATLWDLRWVNPQGKTVKTAAISYPTGLLKSGAEFYRNVFKQLWLKDWRNPTILDSKETAEGFWRGAARMGVSRESTLQASEKLVVGRDKNPEGEWIPELAGLLVHSGLPRYGSSTSLDSVLLARGAAWLAFAEYLTTVKLDSLWAPVLFQAGRETAAAALWQASGSAKLEGGTPQQQGWNIWLRKPASKEVFLYGTAPTNLAMAMPMLAYDARVNGSGKTLAELIGLLVGSPRELATLHNYAPLFATGTSIGGGRILEGAWPIFARQAWLECLSKFTPARGDYEGYRQLLRQASNSVPAALKQRSENDPSLLGLRELAPLLSLGHSEGTGPLIPVGAVTARDLLNYGWEETGLQMGARYNFVRSRWGVEELADPIFKIVTANIEGLMPFFRRERDANLQNYRADLGRLQLVPGLFHLVGFSTPATDAGEETQAGVRLFVKRAWLRPPDLEWQARSLWDVNAGPDVPPLLRAFQEEAGTWGAAAGLGYLSLLNREALLQTPDGPKLKISLAESLPQPSKLKIDATYYEKFRGMDNFSLGQAYERLYWQNPDMGIESTLVFNYLFSGSFKSARRFYLQARSNFLDTVAFSNDLGVQLYITGYCLGDAELRKDALEDSNSGSYMALMMAIWEAAIGDNPKGFESAVNELVERYEADQGADAQGKRLQKFLPLLPALLDPKHPARREALEYFGKDDGWTVLRFIWIEKFKLPVADAITLLGGRENTPLHRVIIAVLEKDHGASLDALNQMHSSGRADTSDQAILAACLFSRLHPLSPPHDEPDLKPAGATSTRQAVLEQLRKTGRLHEDQLKR